MDRFVLLILFVGGLLSVAVGHYGVVAIMLRLLLLLLLNNIRYAWLGCMLAFKDGSLDVGCFINLLAGFALDRCYHHHVGLYHYSLFDF